MVNETFRRSQARTVASPPRPKICAARGTRRYLRKNESYAVFRAVSTGEEPTLPSIRVSLKPLFASSSNAPAIS